MPLKIIDNLIVHLKQLTQIFRLYFPSLKSVDDWIRKTFHCREIHEVKTLTFFGTGTTYRIVNVSMKTAPSKIAFLSFGCMRRIRTYAELAERNYQIIIPILYQILV